MYDPFANTGPRPFAIAAIVLFVPVAATFFLAPGIWWVDYPGILFHLAMFGVVAKLDAPDWAKAAGFGWLFLDVATGAMTLNHVPRSIALYLRFGGHIFAGIWIVGASLGGRRWMRIVGVVTGAWMSLYTFVSPFVTAKALAPASLLVIVWLVIVARDYGPATVRADTPAT